MKFSIIITKQLQHRQAKLKQLRKAGNPKQREIKKH